MKFIINRVTTTFGGVCRGDQPCESAALESGSGRDRVWSIEVESIGQLMEIARLDSGGIIVTDGPPTITIYDGYIE